MHFDKRLLPCLGFTKESFDLLEAKVEEEAQRGNPVFVSLVYDEVSIRKKIVWDGNKFVGCIDLGKNNTTKM